MTHHKKWNDIRKGKDDLARIARTVSKSKISQETIDDFAGYIGEGFHTAFRKAADSDRADQIWHLIRDMPSDEWGAIVSFVAEPVLEYAKEILTRERND